MSDSQRFSPACVVLLSRLGRLLRILPAASLLMMGPAHAEDLIRVAVSILPHAYFVERVAGDHAEVEVMVGPGQSPHTYDPTSRQWARLSGASVYFATGVEMENLLLPRISRAFPGIRIVDTTAGIHMQTMEGEPLSQQVSGAASDAEDGHVHGEDCDHDHAYEDLLSIELPGHEPGDGAGEHHHVHGEDCDHPPGSVDPHVWLSPRNAGIQAGLMAEALIQADPQNASSYKANLDLFLDELAALDAELAETLAPLRGKSIFVFHPAFGYLLSAYGMTQTAIEKGGLDPGTKHLTEVIEQGRSMGVTAIFVSPQFSKASARMVAREIGAQVVVIDPLARDYIGNLRSMAAAIRESHGS